MWKLQDLFWYRTELKQNVSIVYTSTNTFYKSNFLCFFKNLNKNFIDSILVGGDSCYLDTDILKHFLWISKTVEKCALDGCGHSEIWETFYDAFRSLYKPGMKHMGSLWVYIWVVFGLDAHNYKVST